MKHIELLHAIKEKSGIILVTITVSETTKTFKLEEATTEEFLLLKLLKRGMQKEGLLTIQQTLPNATFSASISLGNATYSYLSAKEGARLHPENSSTIFVPFSQLRDKELHSFTKAYDSLSILEISKHPFIHHNQEEDALSSTGKLLFKYKKQEYTANISYLLFHQHEIGIGFEVRFEPRFFQVITDESEQMHVYEMISELVDVDELLFPFTEPLFTQYYKEHGYYHSLDPNN